uniref:Uncharacterized protein n=1 Tax=Anopheles albimanus TaxID=7167 RepID=A0A182FYP6_ANOAL
MRKRNLEVIFKVSISYIPKYSPTRNVPSKNETLIHSGAAAMLESRAFFVFCKN